MIVIIVDKIGYRKYSKDILRKKSFYVFFKYPIDIRILFRA